MACTLDNGRREAPVRLSAAVMRVHAGAPRARDVTPAVPGRIRRIACPFVVDTAHVLSERRHPRPIAA